MNIFKGYRFDHSDGSSSLFFKNDEMVCSISTNYVGGFHASISTPYNRFISEKTFISKSEKYFIKNKNTDKNAYCIVYRAEGYNDIVFSDAVISVHFDDEGYYFSHEGKDLGCITYQTRRKAKAPNDLRGYHDLCYSAILLEDFEDNVLAAILSFPFVHLSKI